MAALGSTPTYYDFDMFQEMQVTTGGADVTSPTPGVQLNLVLKSGTQHAARQHAHLFRERRPAGEQPARRPDGDDRRHDRARATAWTSTTTPASSSAGRSSRTVSGRGARTARRRRLSSRSDLRHARPDRAEGLVVQGDRPGDNGLRANFTFFRGDKEKFGRVPRSDSRRRDHLRPERPDHAVQGRRQLRHRQQPVPAARGSHVDGGFQLAAHGGPTQTLMYVDDGGVIRGSTDTYATDRPQNNISVDGNSFSGRHELKFGFGWRKATVDSTDAYPGNGVVSASTSAIRTCSRSHAPGHAADRRGLHQRLRAATPVAGSR